MKCVKQNSPREWQIGADLTANKPISEIFHAFCSVGGWGVEESRGREVGGTGGKRRGREEGRPILRVGCGAERWMAIFSFSPSSLLLFLTLSGSRLQQSLLWRLEKSARSTQVWLSSKDAPLCSDQPIWLHTRQHKENDGPVVIFAQLPSSLFTSIICLPRCYHEASNFTGTLLLLSDSTQVLQVPQQVFKSEATCRFHHREQWFICVVLFCLCSLCPSGCSSALTELTGGLTVEFYHHPFSPLYPTPSLSLALSLFLASLASIGNFISLFSSV